MLEKTSLERIISMACGRIKAELLIINCRFVDVFNLELIDGPIAIGEGKIIGWGEGYEAEAILDAGGGIVLPGLIDGHVHIESSTLTPAQFAQCILPHGTTSIIADPHEIANVKGVAGIRYMLEAAKDLPLHIKFMLPSCVPATPFELAGAVLEAKDLTPLLDEKDVIGLAEVMDYPSVINCADSMMNKLMMAKKAGCIIDGHSPGVSGKGLMAYSAAGIMTDHECGDTKAMIERLRMGQYILLREGSTCKDLLNLIPAITAANARRCILCTDDRAPDDILESGHINKSLRLAVAAGLDPLLAVSIATLNAAECFRLRGKGAIAPGYDADLLIVDTLKNFTPMHVFSDGIEVARNGKMLVPVKGYVSKDVLNTMHLPKLTKESFALPLTTDKALAIGVVPKSIVTQRVEMAVRRNANGYFDASLNPGLNKIAVIERYMATGDIGVGILAGYCIKNGAIATTIAHDSHNLVVAGDNDEDMLMAAETVASIGGGVAVCWNKEILATMPLPIAGLMSELTAEQASEAWAKVLHAAHKGLQISEALHPLMALAFMSLPVIPNLKLTTKGLFDVTTFSLTPVSIA